MKDLSKDTSNWRSCPIDHLHDTHDERIFIIFSMASEDEEEKWNEVYFKD